MPDGRRRAAWLSAQGVPFERLDTVEIMRRWPRFHRDDDVSGIHQRDGGIAPARKSRNA